MTTLGQWVEGARPRTLPAALSPVLIGCGAAAAADGRSGLKVSKGQGILPNESGQVWREYEISSYTLRVRDVVKPKAPACTGALHQAGRRQGGLSRAVPSDAEPGHRRRGPGPRRDRRRGPRAARP